MQQIIRLFAIQTTNLLFASRQNFKCISSQKSGKKNIIIIKIKSKLEMRLQLRSFTFHAIDHFLVTLNVSPYHYRSSDNTFSDFPTTTATRNHYTIPIEKICLLDQPFSRKEALLIQCIDRLHFNYLSHHHPFIEAISKSITHFLFSFDWYFSLPLSLSFGEEFCKNQSCA